MTAPSLAELKRLVLGKARDPRDPNVFRHVSLVAFLAWVGLGADGLSSSAYGPEAAFVTLGAHTHLAILLAALTAITVVVISLAYSTLIEHFPGGGGGYLVATKLLGKHLGVVSGCALLVDYILTITTSVAGGCDAIFSFLPPGVHAWKLPAEVAVLLVLIVLNLRGAKESVLVLLPIFVVFMLTHVFMILWAIGSRVTGLPEVFHGAALDFRSSLHSLGFAPLAFLILRAYSMGGGTYTGIEAVSNGLSILAEPRVQTGKKTMALMALSLAFTAGGILFGYLLVNAVPEPGKTLNAVLLERLFSGWTLGGVRVGISLVILTLVSEGALLFMAAQTGFIDGPRVLANMAIDSWVPHRFAQLSDRLVTKNGVYLMGALAIAICLYTRGEMALLLVMYSINVFITFSLTELGMSRHWIQERKREAGWKRLLALHGTGLVMCVSILVVTLRVRFAQGGWLTIAITATAIVLCFRIRRHYERVKQEIKEIDQILGDLPVREHADGASGPLDPKEPTAVLFVSGYNGIGIHTLLSIQRYFPKQYKNTLFVSVGVVDSASFKGAAEVKSLEEKTKADLEKYVALAGKLGLRAETRWAIGTEAVQEAANLGQKIAAQFPRSMFFLGKLVFQKETFVNRLLHNQTASDIQRRLAFEGLPTVVLPIRVLDRAA